MKPSAVRRLHWSPIASSVLNPPVTKRGDPAHQSNDMLLRIQREESIRSYVERNIYLNRNDSSVNVFAQLSKFSIRSYEIKNIAKTMGWFGCYGFNKLLHKHTYYPVESIFKNIQDISYSGDEYHRGGNSYGSERNIAAFCPECVREDLKSLGFSYWRRLHHDTKWSLKVCAKHNVLLITLCQFCGKPFSYQGHGLDIMWRTCGGRHLAESVSTRNDDFVELKKSKMYEDVISFDFHISRKLAINTLSNNFSCGKSIRIDSINEVEVLIDRVYSMSDIKHEDVIDNSFSCSSSNNELLFNALMQTYDSFNDFLLDIKIHDHELRSVESLWSTYWAGGYESAQYVDEDYIYGVGRWSCPHPSPNSACLGSNDYYASRRPITYPCCNFEPTKQKGHQLKARMARPPLPRIPVVDVEMFKS